MIDALIRAALEEDAAFRDVTTLATIPADARARASLRARQPGVVAGVECVRATFQALSPECRINVISGDGAVVTAGQVVLVVAGPARAVLSGERVALNFIQRLSGVATLTSRYVEAVRGTKARILDTRKTTPGWRVIEKAAVRAGGGTNHRMDLASAVLIKDNHLQAVGGDIARAIALVRAALPAGAEVEVEADTLEQVEQSLAAGAERILLDNMSLDQMRACVVLTAGRARLEASGGVNLTTVRAIAETGVDDISVGALTHSAPSLDLGLDFD
jgi:nicotinate-nucleotide pyrophosphorylase (carboxylating)